MTAAEGFEERELVARFAACPTAETYSALYRSFASRVLNYFRGRGCNRELSEDLMQEVMLTVYRRMGQLREVDLFRAWLFRIARNALLQHHRQAGREIETAELTDAAAPPADPLGQAQLGQWLAILTPAEREATLLRHVEGLEYHEIATVLDAPIGTVQWRVFQAKRKLAAHFGTAREGGAKF